MSAPRWIYLWEPELSPHKLPLFRELQSRPGIRVKYIYEQEISPERRALGWPMAPNHDHDIVQVHGEAEVDALILDAPADCVHVFSGIHWVPSIVRGLMQCVTLGLRFGLMHEPRVLEGITGKLRLLHSWVSETALKDRADFVLAIGAHGPRWFRLAGYHPQRIFPFAYFLEMPSAAVGSRSATPQVGFVGRLERAKGFDLFLDAVAQLKTPVEVQIAGAGALAAQAQGHGVYHGALPFAQVASLMAQLDVLVLPSRTTDDGWGAVISEALMAGAGVVCSDRVGASMVIVRPEFGRTVARLSGKDIARAIEHMAQPDMTSARVRTERSIWARAHLNQQAGADYLLAIFDYLYGDAPRPASFVSDRS